ncbi:unnamed protein product [Brassica rapa]|uniref:Non-specific lipid-transfer protein n=1 Tax=Brassica campestris TaxID=3711 RepID=A0A3P5ZXU0_BRACM|nr:unnamed protein product [Brassica rapa]VDC80154.1 unnamed protein product [Brassica rapa]
MAGLMKLACFVVACMIVAGPITANAALSCASVVSNMAPCISYLRGSTGAISSACCSGVKNINGLSRTPSDRQIACGCLKRVVTLPNNINADRAAGLPNACGISLPYNISKSANCTLYVNFSLSRYLSDIYMKIKV